MLGRFIGVCGVAGACALLFGACDAGDAGPAAPVQPPPAPVSAESLREAVQPIFTRSCAFTACHAGTSPQAGLDLSAGNAHANLVNVAATQVPRLMRVDPARPDSSYLLLKLRGVAGAVGGLGTQMPLGGQLSAAQIDTVRIWIDAGAQNN